MFFHQHPFSNSSFISRVAFNQLLNPFCIFNSPLLSSIFIFPSLLSPFLSLITVLFWFRRRFPMLYFFFIRCCAFIPRYAFLSLFPLPLFLPFLSFIAPSSLHILFVFLFFIHLTSHFHILSLRFHPLLPFSIFISSPFISPFFIFCVPALLFFPHHLRFPVSHIFLIAFFSLFLRLSSSVPSPLPSSLSCLLYPLLTSPSSIASSTQQFPALLFSLPLTMF